nr:hypothetical protein BaRGS_025364 [Batillaria attramentaria]
MKDRNSRFMVLKFGKTLKKSVSSSRNITRDMSSNISELMGSSVLWEKVDSGRARIMKLRVVSKSVGSLMYAKNMLKSVKENLVVYGVESCGKIQQRENRNFTIIKRQQEKKTKKDTTTKKMMMMMKMMTTMTTTKKMIMMKMMTTTTKKKKNDKKDKEG